VLNLIIIKWRKSEKCCVSDDDDDDDNNNNNNLSDTKLGRRELHTDFWL
jgi:hypothetical protein